MMRVNRRRVKWGIGVMLIVLTILCVALWPRHASLLDRAVAVVDCRSWSLDPEQQLGYYWLSNHEILFLRGSRQKGWKLYSYNLTTRSESPLQAVTRLFAGSAGEPADLQVSPDGAWLLWIDDVGPPLFKKTVMVVSRDGLRNLRFPNIDTRCQLRWMGDSRSWAELHIASTGKSLDFSEAYLHRLHSDAVQRIPLASTQSFGPNYTPVIAHAFITPDDRLLTGGYDTRSTDIIERPLRPGSSPPRRIRSPMLLMPPSPQGDRVAWISPEPWSSIWADWLHLPLPTPSWMKMQLWVSRLDGSQAHEIGELKVPYATKIFEDQYLLRWLPDGNYLSFVYRNKLYVVPTD